MKKTKGGWLAQWKYGVKGTNLSPTKEQKRTWFLWGYNPRGGQATLASVRKVGGTYDVRDDTRGGKLMYSFGGSGALVKAKKAAEKRFGIK